MAPSSAQLAANDNSARPAARFDTFQSWLAIYGNAEYVAYKRDAATPHLSYEDWVSSEHSLGPYLYHLTLDAWEEETSSDEELEESVQHASRGAAGQGPTETVTTNGNGLPHSVHSSTATKATEVEEPVTSPKRRRRQRKKFLSEAIISPEDVGDSPTSATDTKAEEIVVPNKKRRPREKSVPEPILSPEDIQEFTPVAEIATPTTPTATPDGPSTSSATRRGLRVRTPAQQRPYFHHAKLFEEADPEVRELGSNIGPSPATKSKLAQVSYPNSEEDVLDNELEEVIADNPDEPASGPKKFKGKGRAWKKDEEDEDDDFRVGNYAKKPKKRGRPRKSQLSETPTSATNVEEDDEYETAAFPTPTQKEPRAQRKPRKSLLSEEFVRDESDSDVQLLEPTGPIASEEPAEADDDDEEVVVVSQSNLAERPKRRPRKSYLSKEFIGDNSDEEEPDAGQVEASSPPAMERPTQSTPRRRRQPRKHLSEEFVRDDTNTEEEPEEDAGNSMPVASATETPSAKRRMSNEVHEKEQPASSKKSTPRRRPKKTEQPASLQTANVYEDREGGQDREGSQVMSSPLRKGRRRKTGSLGSVSSVH